MTGREALSGVALQLIAGINFLVLGSIFVWRDIVSGFPTIQPPTVPIREVLSIADEKLLISPQNLFTVGWLICRRLQMSALVNKDSDFNSVRHSLCAFIKVNNIGLIDSGCCLPRSCSLLFPNNSHED